MLGASFAVLAAEPSLELDVGGQTQHLSRKQMLKNPAVRDIEVPADVAYQRTMSYRALPFSALFPSVAQGASVQFTASDGFVANLPGTVFSGKAQPWLAIEEEESAWPSLKAGSGSAGPFYLVWLNSAKAEISPEQWPYQIEKIAVMMPLEVRYPQIRLNDQATLSAQRGMQIYVENCATCHTLNHGGDATIGPDLNQPFSPTEYFEERFLRQLIRDPAAVRNWQQRVMPGFSSSVLSDQKLDDLIAYLRQMAKQR